VPLWLATSKKEPRPASSRPPRERSQRAARRRWSAVIVEDNDDLRSIVSEALAYDGWDVRAFARAESALAAIDRRRPDVVLTDVNLGSLSGFGLARALRADPATEDLVIVAASGSVAPTAKLLRVFDAFLLKPLDLRSLAEWLRELVDREEPA
jgi:two-component system OmpR family response regulator